MYCCCVYMLLCRYVRVSYISTGTTTQRRRRSKRERRCQYEQQRTMHNLPFPGGDKLHSSYIHIYIWFILLSKMGVLLYNDSRWRKIVELEIFSFYTGHQAIHPTIPTEPQGSFQLRPHHPINYYNYNARVCSLSVVVVFVLQEKGCFLFAVSRHARETCLLLPAGGGLLRRISRAACWPLQEERRAEREEGLVPPLSFVVFALRAEELAFF